MDFSFWDIIKRANGASVAFSLVMKTNNVSGYLSSPGIRVFTRNTRLHQEYASSPGYYVSSPGVSVLNWHMRHQLANVSSTCIMCRQLAYESASGEYMSSPRIDAHVFQRAPPSLGYEYKKSRSHHPVFKSIKTQVADHGMDRCHYAVPFKGIKAIQ